MHAAAALLAVALTACGKKEEPQQVEAAPVAVPTTEDKTAWNAYLNDVAGRHITMVSASSFVNPDASEVDDELVDPTRVEGAGNPAGGIGRANNFLEINVANGDNSTGVLRAYDMADEGNTQGIFIDEMDGHLYVHTVKTSENVSLRTKAGSILDRKIGKVTEADLADWAKRV
mgnify:CR=1 FL=1